MAHARSARLAIAATTLSVLGAAATACEEESSEPGGTYAVPEAGGFSLGDASAAGASADGATVVDAGRVADARADGADAASDAMIDPWTPLPDDDVEFTIPTGPDRIDPARDVLLAFFSMPG